MCQSTGTTRRLWGPSRKPQVLQDRWNIARQSTMAYLGQSTDEPCGCSSQSNAQAFHRYGIALADKSTHFGPHTGRCDSWLFVEAVHIADAARPPSSLANHVVRLLLVNEKGWKVAEQCTSVGVMNESHGKRWPNKWRLILIGHHQNQVYEGQ